MAESERTAEEAAAEEAAAEAVRLEEIQVARVRLERLLKHKSPEAGLASAQAIRNLVAAQDDWVHIPMAAFKAADHPGPWGDSNATAYTEGWLPLGDESGIDLAAKKTIEVERVGNKAIPHFDIPASDEALARLKQDTLLSDLDATKRLAELRQQEIIVSDKKDEDLPIKDLRELTLARTPITDPYVRPVPQVPEKHGWRNR